MKNIKYIITACLGLSILLFASCSDKDEERIIDVENVSGIGFEGIEGNLLTLTQLDTYQVKMNVKPEKAADIDEYKEFVFASDNNSVFTVDANGLVTAHGVGEAVLSVSAKHKPEIKAMSIVKVLLKIYPVTDIVIPTKWVDAKLFLGSKLDLSELVALPEQAQNKKLEFTLSDDKLATISDEGIVTLLGVGELTITAKATDGSGITKPFTITITTGGEIEFEALNRSGWTITPFFPQVPDSGIGGTREDLIDGDIATGLSLNKPGKGNAPKDAIVGFMIENTEAIEFNAVRLVHRKHQAYLAVQGIDLLGSNDGTTFEVIEKGIATPYLVANSDDRVVTRLLTIGTTKKYKYIRVEYSSLLMNAGNTAQVMEFDLGMGK